jgi:predicted ATP-grasp superfamily ATP-dependent carboligase
VVRGGVGRGAVVLAALSARALAEKAQAAGLLPFAADGFGDADLRALARGFRKLEAGVDTGLDPASFHAALESLFAEAEELAGRPALGLIYGSGVEAAPEALLGPFANRLLGNPPELIALLKDPSRFAALLARLGIPHPALHEGPAPHPGFLLKRRGGAGGAHIRRARPGERPGADAYLQAEARGLPVSALFLADGRKSRVLFFSEQFPDPVPEAPFRYGGAIRPAALEARAAAGMEEAIAALTRAVGLRGLNSADFLLEPPERWVLLEINPRPGATLDLAPAAVLAWHIAACRGRLPPPPPPPRGGRGAAVVYAPAPLRIPADFSWPGWTRDRPLPGAEIAAGAPLCTILARSVEADGAAREAVRRLLDARRRHLLARLGAPLG